MSRLENVQRNKITRTISVFIVLLIITVILVSTVGFKLLLNTSVFVANLFSKNTVEVPNKTSDVFGTINIDNIPTATNSAEFIVSGSVVNYDKLEFFLNEEKVKVVNTSTNDTFSEKIGDLNVGTNNFYIRALISESKIKKNTTTYTILYKDSKPKLEISQPQDREKTSQTEIILKGVTDKEVFVRVNELPVVVDASGNFQTSIRLKEGDNTIVVMASDIAGNVETKTLMVSFQKE